MKMTLSERRAAGTTKAAGPTAQDKPSEASGTPLSMYSAKETAAREPTEQAPATRQESDTKKPAQTFMDGDQSLNAIGLRVGGQFEPSTHRAPVQRSVHKEAPPNFEPFAFAREKYGAKI